MPAESEHIRTILKTLPHQPGVYQYFDEGGTIIYVGKAKNLKNRVSSYFNKTKHESGKTHLLVRKVVDIKTIVVDSEHDALFLENSLIKKHQPKYNVLLKDDKTYPWICIKNERFPRVFSTRKLIRDGSQYFGPYSSVRMMNTLLELVRQLYPLRTCNYNLSEENIASEKFKVCLEYHIGNCLGPCAGHQTVVDYDPNIKAIKEILKGNVHSVIKHLKGLMQGYAAALKFEDAQLAKERVELLEHFQASSTVVSPSIHNVDVMTIVSDKEAGYINYLKVINGAIIQGHTIELKKRLDEDDAALLELGIAELLQRFKSTAKEILVPFVPELEWEEIKFHVPQRGDKRKLLELSERNAMHVMREKHKQEKFTDPDRHTNRILETIQKDLRLSELPVHIECFDNSNIQGTNPVSACVVFKDAKPSKKDYRHFNIKTVVGPDDFASMEEAVFRRYRRLLEEEQPLPQLIVIDGGKGQLSSSVTALERLGLRGKIAIVGIAKRLEEIYFPGDSIPIYIDKRSESLKVIQHLRNEAHRFGITHHRNRRSKGALQSQLTEIPGVGEKTMQKLMTHFRSVKRMSEATEEQLAAVVNKKQTAAILAHFAKS
jgi:excinuclease ABC subunit C